MTVWEPVVGWETEYEVSDCGAIRTIPRVEIMRNGRRRVIRQIVLRPAAARNGYLRVAFSRGGAQTNASVHRVVLEAFAGPALPRQQARHLNGIKSDCRLANLMWGTGEENQADRIRHGTDHRGEKHPNVKLTEGLVRAIREKRAAGETYVSIAASIGTTKQTVCAIVKRRNWAWL